MGALIKIIILAIVAGLVFKKTRIFLSKFWLAFVAPAARRVDEKAADVVSQEPLASYDEPLSQNQAEEVRK